MYAKFNSLQGRYSSLQALLASNTTTQTPPQGKDPKPSPRKEGEPEVQEFEGRT